MFIEQYEYTVNLGMGDQWERFMLDQAVPYQRGRGMRIMGLFWADDEHTRFIWMRAFTNDEERERLYTAVYDSDDWQQNYLPEVRRLVVKGSSRTTRLDPMGESSMYSEEMPADQMVREA
ncbi:NIPSNAP family protein [Rhodococcus qingshengii]|uniref:NIPSNAP family protein n=1 Tax=Rhodococcus qingshengii TaxID=334542 RepID=UPI0014560FCA|nr:NIPSNAP family protein [Rhodococcus qingshengii]